MQPSSLPSAAPSSELHNDWIDFWKAVGCLLMVLAHTPVVAKGDAFFESLAFIGGFAPVIFFSIAGSNAVHLPKKYSYGQIATFCGLLAFLGFTFSALIGRPLNKIFYFDVFQTIGAGVLIVALCAAVVSRAITWLGLTLAVWLAYALLPNLLPGILTPDAGRSTFALLPWLSLFFLGAWLHTVRASIALLSGGAFLCAMLLSGFFAPADLVPVTGKAKIIVDGILPVVLDKWTTSFGYIFLIAALTAFIFAQINANPPVKGRQAFYRFGFLGRESLQFHYWHIIAIMSLAFLPPDQMANLPQTAAWAVVFGFGCFMTWTSHGAGAKRAAQGKASIMSMPSSWWILALLMTAVTAYLVAYPIVFGQLIWIGLATFFADQYRYMRPAFFADRQKVLVSVAESA